MGSRRTGTAALALVAATVTTLAMAVPGEPGVSAAPNGLLPNFAQAGSDLIRLQAGAFDPLASQAPAGAGLPLVNPADLPGDTPHYWLVQVNGTQYAEATAAIDAAGGLVAGFVPASTYIVRATRSEEAAIAASPAVRWAGYYQPTWRVPVAAGGKPGLLELAGPQTYRVRVFRREPNAAAVGRALRAIPGVEIVADATHVVDVRATAAEVPAIAAVNGVEWVGLRPTVQLHNANARWVTDTGVRDGFAATRTGRLTGAGQTAAVADTGLNYTYDLNGRAHVAFRDCAPDGTGCKEAVYTSNQPGVTTTAAVTNVRNNATGHRKMVAYFDLGGAGPNMFDTSSHGSHTGGSVSGDQAPYGAYTGEDGLAPGARHVHQNIADTGGGLAGLPDDYYQLFRQAYRPRNPAGVAETSPATGNTNDYCVEGTGSCAYRPLEDARTHNNSYGLIVPIVDDGQADLLDWFVWEHEDMLVVVSAGNDGPALGTIGSPAVAKNNLASGAGPNGRQPMTSIDSVAVFSSHGPTGDGRFGPDLITPGQIVVSVKGGSTDGYHTAQGTSMSGPVLTGLATLVRQYYFDGYGAANFSATAPGGGGFAAGAPAATRRHNPSAALVRATLVNGAVRLRGFYSGDDGGNRSLDGQWPSFGQGFGRVNLDNSLYFANDPTNLWFMDVYRGDTASTAACTAAGGTATSSCTSFQAGANMTRSFTLRVDPGQPLDVTLAWTDPGTNAVAGTPALINNLNLTVTGPGGATYVGNNFNSRTSPGVAVAETPSGQASPDVRNNVERIRLANPEAGTYTITVGAPALPAARQGFALTASGNVSPAGGSGFSPGPALQADEPGSPTISNVKVSAISANTARITFTTSEPTTATATATVAGGPRTFVDSYNIGGAADWPGLGIGTVETSTDYANKPVVGTKHEILLIGFTPGQSASVTLAARDLAGNTESQATTVRTPSTVFQANAPDIGQLYADPSAATVGMWRTGTQLYASDDGGLGGILGAFMFRIPQAAVDPADVSWAAVELTSSHNWVIPYFGDPQLSVDLLPASLESNWGTQNYSAIHDAPSEARLNPETTHLRGAYERYDFSFRCADLPKLMSTLSAAGGERAAAFRYEATVATPQQLFAMEFGFNRRSRGPEFRPKLILSTNNDQNPTGEPCDPDAPAPAISAVGIHDGTQAGSVTVSWETDVPSDSLVLFREIGALSWTQVGSPVRTTVHSVQVFGLDRTKQYEFVVRSASCNGAATVDTNGGRGYAFFYPQIPTITRYFTGSSADQANKLANNPTATFSATAPTGEPPIVQTVETTFQGGNHDTFHNARGAYWDGVVPSTLPAGGKLTLRLFLSSVNGNVFATSPTLTLFKNGTKVHQEGIAVSVGAVPVENTIRVTLSSPIEAGSSLSIQITDQFVNNDLQVYYGAASTPSSFEATLVVPPNLPLAGPVPPPPAREGGVVAPELRTGPASTADVAAGTALCRIAGEGAAADLSVTKSDEPDPVRAGDELTYTARVANAGPDAAEAVRLTDPLPAAVTLLSATSTIGTCTGTATVVCTLGTLASGGEALVTIRVRVDANPPPSISNTASVTSETADPDPTDDSATATTAVTSNSPPSAVADAASVARGGIVDVDVLANDSDPDGDTLTVASFTQGANGAVTQNPDGTLRYTHDGSATSSDSFAYTVSDGRGGADNATVRIAVVEPTSGDAATGGGWLAAADDGKINFGFSVKDTGGGLEGTLQLNDRGAGAKIHLFEPTSLGAVSSACEGVPAGPSSVEFSGRGTYNGTAATFRVCVQDNGEPGTADRLSLACTSGCTYRTSSRAADAVLDGGNLQVRRGGATEASTFRLRSTTRARTAQEAGASTMILDPVLLTEAAIGGVQVFTVSVYDRDQRLLPNASVTLTGGGQTFTLTTDVAGKAFFLVMALAEPAEYVATAGAAQSNTIQLTPVLAR